MVHRLWKTMPAVAFLGVCFASQAAGSDAAERMVTQLTRYRNALRTVQTRYRLDTLDLPAEPAPNKITHRTMHCLHDFAANAKVVDITSRIADGTVLKERFAIEPGWERPTYSQSKGDPPALLEITGGDQVASTMQTWETPLWFLGLELPDLPYGLDQLAATVATEDLGAKTVAGHECVGFSLDVPDSPLALVVACDPAQDFLPRQIAVTYGGKHSRKLTVQSFVDVVDRATGETFSFPQTALLERIRGRVRFVGEDIAVNEPIGRAEFAVDTRNLPEGVRVSLPDMEGTRFTGDRLDLYRERTENAWASPTDENAPTMNVIDPEAAHGPAAQASHRTFRSAALVAVGVVLAGLGIWLGVRTKSS